MDPVLLNPKLSIPSVRAGLVQRPRLHKCLDNFHNWHMAVVSAPAGYGKTTLLAEWASQLSHPVVWYALEESDNDIARFTGYLSEAFIRLDSSIKVADDSILFPGRLIEQASNILAGKSERYVLILDDYHLITTSSVQQAVSSLLESMPANFHVVIASRADPALPLPRFRASGQLVELRLSDLRFSGAESSDFLHRLMGLDLQETDVDRLVAKTEGWPAGLQLAAISLQKSDPDRIGSFVNEFTGRDTFILDYLMEEVFLTLPEPLQNFLLKTSILKKMNGSLCDSVTGLRDGRKRLDQLERLNLFVFKLDHERCWYRYHRLFADLLQQKLSESGVDDESALHNRACKWFEQHEMLEDAMEHAVAGRLFVSAASILEKYGQTLLLQSQFHTFQGWIHRIPPHTISQHAGLTYLMEWVGLFGGVDQEWVFPSLQGSGMDDPRRYPMQAYLANLQGRSETGLELCRKAVRQLDHSNPFFRFAAAWVLGMIQIFDGQFQDAQATLRELIPNQSRGSNLLFSIIAHSHQAEIAIRLADLPRARFSYNEALRISVGPDGRRLPASVKALSGMAEVLREMNLIPEALSCIKEALDIYDEWPMPAALGSCLTLARIRQMQGDHPAALQALERAADMAQSTAYTKMDDRAVDYYRALLNVQQGYIHPVKQWLESNHFTYEVDVSELDQKDDVIGYHLRKFEYLVAARAWLVLKQPEKAVHLLQNLLPKMVTRGRTGIIIEIQVLMARAQRMLGNHDKALGALSEALQLAEPGGYIRIFIDEGPQIVQLLNQAARKGISPDYCKQLLVAAAQGASGNVQEMTVNGQVEPLTRREIEILQMLDRGLNNQEIAVRLFISLSTVKWHTSRIYAKLGTANRGQAAAKARTMQLLD